MCTDNPTAIALVIMQVNNLVQILKGHSVTRHAEVDGKSVADALTGLRTVIDDFLAEK
jgi:hypothetical protein